MSIIPDEWTLNTLHTHRMILNDCNSIFFFIFFFPFDRSNCLNNVIRSKVQQDCESMLKILIKAFRLSIMLTQTATSVSIWKLLVYFEWLHFDLLANLLLNLFLLNCCAKEKNFTIKLHSALQMVTFRARFISIFTWIHFISHGKNSCLCIYTFCIHSF